MPGMNILSKSTCVPKNISFIGGCQRGSPFVNSEIKYSTVFGYILYYKLKFAKFVQFSTVQNKFSTIS